MPSNPLPWPEIKHLPDYMRSLLEAHIRFREDPEGNDLQSDMRKPLSKEDLERLLFDVNWYANVKYDGTNFAISRKNEYFGRRQQITSDSYQKCSIRSYMNTNVLSIAEEILGDYNNKVFLS